MKKALTLLTLTCALFATSASASVLITGFGTGQFSQTTSTFGTNTQTATTYQIVGTDFGNAIYGDLPTSVDISGSNFSLTLTGTLASPVSSSFQINLFDANGNDRLYQGTFSAFTVGVETSVTLTFVNQTGSFDDHVISIGLITTGIGSPLDLTLDTLIAIPEANSIALLGMGVAGLLARRRFKR